MAVARMMGATDSHYESGSWSLGLDEDALNLLDWTRIHCMGYGVG